MLKLEKSVQSPIARVGSILFWSWVWRATLVGSLLWAYAGSRHAERAGPAAIPIPGPPPCVVRAAVDDGLQCRLETYLAPADLCQAAAPR